MAKFQFPDQLWPLSPEFGTKKFFSQILPLLYVRHCCKLSLFAISKKSNEPNLRKLEKTQLWDQLWPLWPKFGIKKIFFKDFTSTACQTLLQAIIVCNFKETNEPNLRKWSQAWCKVQFWPLFPKFGPKTFFCVLTLDDMHCCKL